MRTRRWTAEVDGQTLEFILRDVDPELAEEYLGYNKRNRRAKKALIDSLTIDMTESAFRFNGDTVRFDADGTLIDGQHRLRAIIASGVTVPMLIIDGFDPSVMDTVDQGISRNRARHSGHPFSDLGQHECDGFHRRHSGAGGPQTVHPHPRPQADRLLRGEESTSMTCQPPMSKPGRLRRWLIARRLGLRCLVCNRRAGYGGVCPNPEHNG